MTNYDALIKEYILQRVRGVLKPPSGDLAYPFIDPGAGYGNELWDWDSYFTAHALISACQRFSDSELQRAGLDRQTVAAHSKGCVRNFLAAQEADGYVPILTAAAGLFRGYFHAEHQKGTPLNQHKPFLCQAAQQASEFSGDYDWLDAASLVRYMQYYEQKQYDENSGLFVWQDDIMVGIDNNPTVFFRPPHSCADLYLNCFMVLEYEALAHILACKKDDRAQTYAQKAETLKAAINREMWDERDGLYYSQDVGFHRVTRKIGAFAFHAGLAPRWHSLPLKIRFWGCFLPLYAGVCSLERAQRMCAHLDDPRMVTAYGIRTLASDEKMYDLEKSGNPSNWLGAIWTVANYTVYKGLLRYGFTERAECMRAATLALLGKNLHESGEMFESYQPDTGEPNLHPGFLSWNLLSLELLA